MTRRIRSSVLYVEDSPQKTPGAEHISSMGQIPETPAPTKVRHPILVETLPKFRSTWNNVPFLHFIGHFGGWGKEGFHSLLLGHASSGPHWRLSPGDESNEHEEGTRDAREATGRTDSYSRLTESQRILRYSSIYFFLLVNTFSFYERQYDNMSYWSSQCTRARWD